MQDARIDERENTTLHQMVVLLTSNFEHTGAGGDRLSLDPAYNVQEINVGSFDTSTGALTLSGSALEVNTYL